jgi:hypothetical protein
VLASNKHLDGQLWSATGATSAYRVPMDDLEEAIQEMMSHQEVIQRFKKVFGRDMTPSERKSFFLPQQETSPVHEKG